MTIERSIKPSIELPIDIDQVKGFLADDEAAALYHTALAMSAKAPALEIGSYCGKSTIFIGTACKKAGGVLYALDHHRGSEEHQLGEEYHDPELYDSKVGLMDSFKMFRSNIRTADLEDTVIPIVAALIWPVAAGTRRYQWYLSMAGIVWQQQKPITKAGPAILYPAVSWPFMIYFLTPMKGGRRQ